MCDHLRSRFTLTVTKQESIPLKKALILAYDFPPFNSIGGQRPYAWLKYFREFGKTPRKKRKMGHFNLCADNYAELGKTMQALAEYLPIEYFPMLKDEAARLVKL